jgi:hypothetical protein
VLAATTPAGRYHVYGNIRPRPLRDEHIGASKANFSIFFREKDLTPHAGKHEILVEKMLVLPGCPSGYLEAGSRLEAVP